jgi:hypothetical protein
MRSLVDNMLARLREDWLQTLAISTKTAIVDRRVRYELPQRDHSRQLPVGETAAWLKREQAER